MTNISGCGQGGWTLVMKIDGNKVIKDNLAWASSVKCMNATDK
jgi:hypothetical protein